MLAKQLKDKALDAFAAAHHAGTLGVFIFDNSSGHLVYADDALVASRISLGPGGKHVPIMRDVWYLADGINVLQRMVNDSGTPKGMKSVLMEVKISQRPHQSGRQVCATRVPSMYCARGAADGAFSER